MLRSLSMTVLHSTRRSVHAFFLREKLPAALAKKRAKGKKVQFTDHNIVRTVCRGNAYRFNLQTVIAGKKKKIKGKGPSEEFVRFRIFIFPYPIFSLSSSFPQFFSSSSSLRTCFNAKKLHQPRERRGKRAKS